jgi:pentatricopeptide repeat protein
MHQFPTILFLCLAALTPGADEYELWREGRAFWYDDNWEAAAKTYQQLIEQFPNSSRRCKSEIFLGYCYNKMGEKRKAFEVYDRLVRSSDCSPDTITDAKVERLQIAYSLVESDASLKRVLLDGLEDPDADIRLYAAVWLSELGDNSGIDVFFRVLKEEQDLDRRDTASKHILEIGSEMDKQRMEQLIKDFNSREQGKAKMVRLIIRDLQTNKEELQLNLPITLVNVIINSLDAEHLDYIKSEYQIDLRNPGFDLTNFPRGKMIIKFVDSEKREIKLFVE